MRDKKSCIHTEERTEVARGRGGEAGAIGFGWVLEMVVMIYKWESVDITEMANSTLYTHTHSKTDDEERKHIRESGKVG